MYFFFLIALFKHFFQDFLDQLSAQFRTIQKRLISKFKVKNPTPLTNLEILIKDTYTEILKTVLKLQEANGELFKAQTELTCALNLIGNLIKIMNIDDKLKEILLSVFCPSVEDLDSQVRKYCKNHCSQALIYYILHDNQACILELNTALPFTFTPVRK